MKIQVAQAIKQGLEVVIKNSIILKVVIVNAALSCISHYFLFYAPKLTGTAPVPGPEALLPQLPEHFWLYFILFGLISLFLSLIICKMVYDAVKSNISFSEAMNVSIRKLIPIIVASIVWALIVGVGFIVLIIPGIFLGIKFYFLTYAILLDNEGIVDSFEKSWQITKGNWWGTFALSLIFIIPMIILSSLSNIMVTAGILVLVALAVDFIAVLLASWLISAFTIAYIQLTGKGNKEAVIKAQ